MKNAQDETEPINPSSGTKESRRRRRRHSASDDLKKDGASPDTFNSISSKDETHGDTGSYGQGNNGDVQTGSAQRRRRAHRKNTSESPAGGSGDSREHVHQIRSNERRRPKRSSPQRMPRSVSEEVLAMQGKFPAQVEGDHNKPPAGRRSRKARRKDPADDSLEEQQTASLERQGLERPLSRTRQRSSQPRRKKKVRSVMITSGEEDNYQGDLDGEVSEIFKVDKEDIIPSDVSQSTGKIPVVTTAATLPSQPLDYLFIEKKDGQGFAREHKSKLTRVEEEQAVFAQDMMMQDGKQTTPLELALQVQIGFRNFALVCHGLLAGLALAQCVFVYSLSETSNTELLANYSKLAQPFQSMYFFLLAICVVSVFDRYVNVSSGWSQFFLSLLTRPSRALAIVAYLFALVFSVSLAQLDDKISLYKESTNLWSSTAQLSTWLIINLLRVIGAILGWLFVSLSPMDDEMAKNLGTIIDQDGGDSRNDARKSVTTWEHEMI